MFRDTFVESLAVDTAIRLAGLLQALSIMGLSIGGGTIGTLGQVLGCLNCLFQQPQRALRGPPNDRCQLFPLNGTCQVLVVFQPKVVPYKGPFDPPEILRCSLRFFGSSRGLRWPSRRARGAANGKRR